MATLAIRLRILEEFRFRLASSQMTIRLIEWDASPATPSRLRAISQLTRTYESPDPKIIETSYHEPVTTFENTRLAIANI